MGSSRRSGLWAAAAMGLAARAAPAQSTGDQLVLAGRLVRVSGADTTPLSGRYVVAHRIGPRGQGPLDSLRTTAGGRFRFVVAAPEEEAVYVVSSRHLGIGYFSAPFAPSDREPAGRIGLAVYDTSSSGPPLSVGVRHVVVTGAGRRALDIVEVNNPGLATRVAADSLGPTFSMSLPDGATDFETGQSEVSASAIRFEGGRLMVSAPFPPGGKQVVVSYSLPAGRGSLLIPVEHETARLEVLVEDSGAAAGAGLARSEPMELEGRRFNRFTAESLGRGGRAEVRFGRRGPRDLRWMAVALALVLLLAGVVLARRRGGLGRGDAPQAATVDSLLAQAAALDERYQGREAQLSPEEWAEYRQRRAELVSRIARRLAQG